MTVPLLAQHEIVSAPSASVLAVLRQQTAGRAAAPKAVAVLADPVFDLDDPRLKVAGRQQPVEVRQVSPISAGEVRLQSDTLARAVRDVSAPGARGTLSRLPFTRQEADAIISMVPQTQSLMAVDFKASREVATSEDIGRYRIVHFATHGLLDDRHPELSGLVLSLVDESGRQQDGFLRLNEIYNLRLDADLVVLSACQARSGMRMLYSSSS